MTTPIHPGHHLTAHIAQHGMPLAELARKNGLDLAQLEAIARGEQSVSPLWANELSMACELVGTQADPERTPKHWLDMQAAFDEANAPKPAA